MVHPFFQVALLHAIRSPSKPLRHVVGTNVAVIVGVGGMPTWPELLMSIVQCLESNDPNALEGALDALYKVLHDTFIANRCVFKPWGFFCMPFKGCYDVARRGVREAYLFSQGL